MCMRKLSKSADISSQRHTPAHVAYACTFALAAASWELWVFFEVRATDVLVIWPLYANP